MLHLRQPGGRPIEPWLSAKTVRRGQQDALADSGPVPRLCGALQAGIPSMAAHGHRGSLLLGFVFLVSSPGRLEGVGFLYKRLLLRGSASTPPLKTQAKNTATHCAWACTRLPDCVSFSLRPGPQGCSLYSNRTTVLNIANETASNLESFYNRYFGFCPSEKGYARVPGTQKCLRVESATKTWTEAEAACEAEGGHLAVVEDVATWQAVRTFLEGVAQGVSDMHVGGVQTSTGSWVWLDGFPVETSLWHPGEPSNDFVNGNCTSIWWADRSANFFLLDDFDCYWNMASLCEI